MKHGSGSEGEHLHSTSSISPCSPGLPQLWEVSMANKGGHMHPNNYMNSFGHWYPNHQPHQDAMPRPQMMWVGCFWCRADQVLGPWTCSQSFRSEVNCVFFFNECLIELCCNSCEYICRCKIRPGSKYIFFRFVIMSLRLLVNGRKLTEMWTLVCAVYSG